MSDHQPGFTVDLEAVRSFGAVFVQAAEDIAAAHAQADTPSGGQFKTRLAVAPTKVDNAIWATEHDPKTGRSA
jgi:hypothetical protein